MKLRAIFFALAYSAAAVFAGDLRLNALGDDDDDNDRHPVMLTLGAHAVFIPPSPEDPEDLGPGIEGVMPGVSLAIQQGSASGVSIALELSTSLPFEVTHESGFIGIDPRQISHVDTQLTLFVGKAIKRWELKAGVSFGMRALQRDAIQGGTEKIAAGGKGLTLGIDRRLPLGSGKSLVPHLRVAYIDRGLSEEERNVLSPLSLRLGIGLRFH